ncbi:MAG: hypothetical protein OK457_07605 [Thaumarchaeota archaeon]|nr:hypothetical protein [Nitrososphaerota archaeon]
MMSSLGALENQESPTDIRWELHSPPGQPRRYHLGCRETGLTPHDFLASIAERGPDSFDLFLDSGSGSAGRLFKAKTKSRIETLPAGAGIAE